MNKAVPLERVLILFMPWAFSLMLNNDFVLSYLIAWLGSFLIFLLSLSGWVRPLPKDRSVAEQLMRPIYLVQVIFAGYMACTSIFYFLNVMGYEYFHLTGESVLVDEQKLQLAAQAQRYYCLGHAAFVTGILCCIDYPKHHKYRIETEKLANLLMMFAVISFPVSLIFIKFPGLSQFSNQLNSLSFIAGTLALAFAIPLKKVINTLICLCFYLFNFSEALVSGFKEPIIISVLVLGIFLYPSYKKIVAVTFVPMLLLLFMFLPTYNETYRQNAWSGGASAGEARQIALDAALNGDSEDQSTSNWDFLVYRLSEIDMFVKFEESTPDKIGYYDLTLINQAATALVPRIFWPSKPSTEDLIMKRVYNAGVVNENSSVSAKPAFIVDAYLSAGGLGVFIFLFFYGMVSQLLSNNAEKLFGGYILGTALIYSGLFQNLWRGLSLEFLSNTIFWSYITMLIIHKILLVTNILTEIENITD